MLQHPGPWPEPKQEIQTMLYSTNNSKFNKPIAFFLELWEALKQTQGLPFFCEDEKSIQLWIEACCEISTWDKESLKAIIDIDSEGEEQTTSAQEAIQPALKLHIA